MRGAERDRTADLLNAIQALSQLSYIPKYALKSEVNLSENHSSDKEKAEHINIIF